MTVCFSKDTAYSQIERNYRFLEESVELVQSLNMSKEQVNKIVEYVYSRPKGESFQEIGGVMVTLTALCSANNIQLNNAALAEENRIWTIIPKIRKKQAIKRDAYQIGK